MKCQYILPLCILILSGCSAEWHLTRAIKKNPDLLKEKVVTVTDTVVVPPVELRDTVRLKEIDTVTLVKDKFYVRIVRSYDTLMIDGGCDADTIIRVVEVGVPQIISKESTMQRVQKYTFWSLVSLLIIAIALIVIRKSVWLN